MVIGKKMQERANGTIPTSLEGIAPGTHVNHKKFGFGKVTEVNANGGITVAFDDPNIGTKRLYRESCERYAVMTLVP